MALRILWSPRALENFHNVISYLEENWTEQVVRTFVIRTEKILQIILDHPEIFRTISDKSQIREAVVTKHNLLIYKTTKTHLLVLAVFDTRQHPKKKRIY
jgi:plasmid stabilization system protein ParE